MFYLNDGRTLDCADRAYFQSSMNGERTLQRINDARLDGGSRFIITVPIKMGEEITGVALGSITVESFEHLLVVDAYAQQGYAVICDAEGNVILNSRNALQNQKTTSLIDIIENGTIKEKSLADLKRDFQKGQSGIVQYTHDGRDWLGVYSCLGVNDWMILDILPQEAVDAQTAPFTRGLWISFVVSLVSILLVAVIFFYRARISSRERENKRIQLMLSQIKPHFLYNTLSAIRALITQDPPTASKLVYDFSKYMRNNIDSLSSNELIPFRDELNHIKAYTEIEKVRFNGLIQVVFEIYEDDFLVPPLSVQPIVENAIKHGLCKKKEGGIVSVKSVKENTCYVITVEDNGTGFVKADNHDGAHSSTGIKNVEFRLKEMCRGTIAITGTPDVGTTAIIKIPVSTGGKA